MRFAALTLCSITTPNPERPGILWPEMYDELVWVNASTVIAVRKHPDHPVTYIATTAGDLFSRDAPALIVDKLEQAFAKPPVEHVGRDG